MPDLNQFREAHENADPDDYIMHADYINALEAEVTRLQKLAEYWGHEAWRQSREQSPCTCEWEDYGYNVPVMTNRDVQCHRHGNESAYWARVQTRVQALWDGEEP